MFMIVLLFSSLFAVLSGEEAKKTICLNMIVKNETHVLARCFDSVLPIIDTWVIVDTGSTDGTQQFIREYMQEKGIPGELHERPWVNFAHNRNEALELGKNRADYLLFIDADEYLVYEPDFKRPDLALDYYYTPTQSGPARYVRMGLIRTALPWKWIGVVHEYIEIPAGRQGGTLEKVVMISEPSGDRSRDPNKYVRDAILLEKDLLQNPGSHRSMFYLAQSYRDAGLPELAIERYAQRAAAGGWDEEVFCSLVQVGMLQEELKKDPSVFINSYFRAYQARRSRVEPLYYIAHHFREQREFAKGYEIAKIGMRLPRPSDILFVQDWMYNYGIGLECSICAYWLGKYDEAIQISEKLLKRQDLPEAYRDCIQRNLGFAYEKQVERALQENLQLVEIQ